MKDAHVHDNYANEISIQDYATVLQSRMCITIQSLCGLLKKLITFLFAKQLTWHASIMHNIIKLLKHMSGSVK